MQQFAFHSAHRTRFLASVTSLPEALSTRMRKRRCFADRDLESAILDLHQQTATTVDRPEVNHVTAMAADTRPAPIMSSSPMALPVWTGEIRQLPADIGDQGMEHNKLTVFHNVVSTTISGSSGDVLPTREAMDDDGRRFPVIRTPPRSNYIGHHQRNSSTTTIKRANDRTCSRPKLSFTIESILAR